MRKEKQGKSLVFPVLLLLLVVLMLYSGLRILESTVLLQEQDRGETRISKTIVRDGKEYFPKQDITTVLVMGIDQFGPVEESIGYTNPGLSDVNIVLIFDERDKVCNVLHLNRDTMVEMPALGIGGKKAGTYYGQLALAHSFGTGLEDSCVNSCETVSGLLYGIPMDYYVSMNMDAISILNDAVGGVTVNVKDDFSQVDKSIGKGEVTLKGEQAINYVRIRKDVGDQKNLSRIERHKEYMEGFVEAFRQKQESSAELIISAYEQVQPYIVTNCSANAISGMVDRYSDYAVSEVVSLEGENFVNEGYYEFHPDEEKLDELILRLFYREK